MTGRALTGVRSESSKLPSRPDASDRTWPDAPRVRSSLLRSLPLWTHDRSRWSHEGSDAPVACSASAHRWTTRTRWSGQTSVRSLTLGVLTEWTDRTRWSSRDRVRSPQWPLFASVSFPTSGAVENRRFTSFYVHLHHDHHFMSMHHLFVILWIPLFATYTFITCVVYA
jgi:hypothetical protein